MRQTCITGNTNESVLPLPVGADTQISLGQKGAGSKCCFNTKGTTFSCTGNKCVTPSFSRVLFKIGCNQSCLSIWQDKFCRSVDIPTGFDNQCGNTLFTCK